MIPEPRDGEQLRAVEVVLTLKTTVQLVDCPRADLRSMAEQVIEPEVEQFCQDYGWEQISVSFAVLAPTEVGP